MLSRLWPRRMFDLLLEHDSKFEVDDVLNQVFAHIRTKRARIFINEESPLRTHLVPSAKNAVAAEMMIRALAALRRRVMKARYCRMY